MTRSTSTPLSLPLNPDQLSLWLVREQAGSLSDTEQQELMRWRQTSQSNETHYQQLLLTWQATQLVPDQHWRSVLEQAPQQASRRRWLRTTFLIGAPALAAGTAVIALPGLRELWQPAPEFTRSYQSARGEQQRIVLPDQSILHLNTDTLVDVAFYADHREVTLHQGEALFDIHKQHDRPFQVLGGLATILVTGTVFNVRRDPQALSIIVQEGQVQVSSGRWWSPSHVSLGPDQRLSLEAGSSSPRLDSTPAQAATAWHTGQLVFSNTPLSEVVRELNRYRPSQQAIQIMDASLASRRIAAVFELRDSADLLETLPELLPLRVNTLPSGEVQLHAR